MKYNWQQVDPQLRLLGKLMKWFNPSFTENRLRFASKFGRMFWVQLKDKAISQSVDIIQRRDGTLMNVIIYKPTKVDSFLPGVLWMHGGGYAIGHPGQSRFFAKKLIEASPCIVFSVDYRLSTQSTYPAALHDCYDALLWMKNQASHLGVRSDQIMIGGDSAGGGLCAALSLYVRDKKEVSIAFQMPLYPMIDDRMQTNSAKNNHAPVWDSLSSYYGWKLYLGDLFETMTVPEYAATSRSKNYANLPPTLTYIGDLEPFRDETIAYVHQLKKAGNTVFFKEFSGCYHAFEQMVPKAKISIKAHDFLMNGFAYAVNHFTLKQPDSH